MKVVEALQRQGERRAGGVAPVDRRGDPPPIGERLLYPMHVTGTPSPYARRLPRRARGRGRGEAQFVVVAACERAAPRAYRAADCCSAAERGTASASTVARTLRAIAGCA